MFGYLLLVQYKTDCLGFKILNFIISGGGGGGLSEKNIFKGMNQLDIFCKSPLILIFLGCIAKSTFCKAKAKNWLFGVLGNILKFQIYFMVCLILISFFFFWGGGANSRWWAMNVTSKNDSTNHSPGSSVYKN